MLVMRLAPAQLFNARHESRVCSKMNGFRWFRVVAMQHVNKATIRGLKDKDRLLILESTQISVTFCRTV